MKGDRVGKKNFIRDGSQYEPYLFSPLPPRNGKRFPFVARFLHKQPGDPGNLHAHRIRTITITVCENGDWGSIFLMESELHSQLH
jgi:hypothetical protein